MDVTYSRISPQTVKVRTIKGMLDLGITLIVVAILIGCTYYFSWWGWLQYIFIGIAVLSSIHFLWDLLWGNKLYYQTVSYGLTDDYLFIRQGIFTKSEVVVPMAKIQSIELTQGLIMRKFNIFEVQVTTMKGIQSISFLEKDIAKQIKEDIAKLARLKELNE